MTAAILLAAAAPWLRQLFPPASMAEQIQRTPILVFAVLISCLAAAYLAMWRAARVTPCFSPWASSTPWLLWKSSLSTSEA